MTGRPLEFSRHEQAPSPSCRPQSWAYRRATRLARLEEGAANQNNSRRPNMQKPDQNTVPRFSRAVARGGEAKLRQFCFLCVVLLAALFTTFTPAVAQNDLWIKCQGGSDEARIVSCSQVIGAGKRTSNRERIVALLNRGRAYLDKKEFDRAILDFTSALSLDRRQQAVYSWRAQAYRAKGQLDKAVVDLGEALALDPTATRLFIERGGTYAEKGDLQRAIEDYSAAIRSSPDLSRAYEERGVIHFAQHDLDAAIADLDKAIALEPQFSDALVGRAAAFRAKGDLAHAKRDLETALRLDPSLHSARNALAELSQPTEAKAQPAPAAKPTRATADTQAGRPRLVSILTRYRMAAVATEFGLILAGLWFFLSRDMKCALNSEMETRDLPVSTKQDRGCPMIVIGRDSQGDRGGENVTADQFRHLMQEHETREEAERVERRHTQQETLEKRLKELAARRLSDAEWRRLLAQARGSASAGMNEFMLIRFPSQLCADGGRAINAPDASWPQTLRGEPADIFARWRQELGPKGFRLTAQVVDFPDGVPGDAALFLEWRA